MSTGGTVLAGVAELALYLTGTNFWNPVGWIGLASLVLLGLSFLFADREKKLQRQKAKAAEQLRGTIDRIENRARGALKKWFYDNVTSRLVRGIRIDTKQMYTGMFDVGRALDDGASRIADVVEGLNRRLLVRTGQFVGAPVPESRLARVVRDPGHRSKLLWVDENMDDHFCREVGRAIGEWVDGVANGAPDRVVAAALRPAAVTPAMVSLSGHSAVARLPPGELGRAIGKGGGNVSLASRLTGLRITVLAEDPHG